MPYIQLRYGLIKKDKQVKFNLPKNYEGSQYIKRLRYIQNKDPYYSNSVNDLIKNRHDLKIPFSYKQLWRRIRGRS